MSELDPRGLEASLPHLLRALRAGHPGQRGRVLRLLFHLDDARLQAEPVRGALLELLLGRDADLSRRVGRHVAARGLAACGEALVELLTRPERRALAESWLGRPGFPRPGPALLRLATDVSAPGPARAAALRLLRGLPLARPELLGLLPALAEPELQAPALALLEPGADAALCEAAVQANVRWGEARAPRSWWGRLVGRPSPLGVLPASATAQRPFVRAIARLALAARHRPLLLELGELLHDPDLGRPLREAWVNERLVEAVPRLVLRLVGHASAERRAAELELLGRLGTRGSVALASNIAVRYVPAPGRPAGPDEQAAIVALARLGYRPPLQSILRGALDLLLEALGRAAQNPGHASTLAPCIEAAGELREVPFADPLLALLRQPELLPDVEPVLAEALVKLDPLELRPTVAALLAGDSSAGTAARRVALEVVRRRPFPDLLPAAVEAAAVLPEAALATLSALLAPGHLPLARRLLEQAGPWPEAADEALVRFLARAQEVLGPEAPLALSEALLARGAGGARAQRAAVRRLAAVPGRLEALTTRLLAAPHSSVRAAALEELLARGLVVPAGAASGADGPPAWADAAVPDLLACAREAFEAGPDGGRVVQLLLDRLLPLAGLPGRLAPEDAEELRARVRALGDLREQASFHGVHRALLDAAARGVDVGPLHGALLALLGGRRLAHPVTGQVGPYGGPLPRFEETERSSSPYVQEGLFALVVSPGYLLTDALLLRFLGSPRARVRAAALGRLSRDAVLRAAEAVLGRLADPDARVRAAVVEALLRHDLERFAPALRPALDDVDGRVRLLAARTLAGWGDASCLGRLTEFLDGADDALRAEAVGALSRFEPADLAGHLAGAVRLDRPRAAAAVLSALRPARLPDDPALRAAILTVAIDGRGPLRARALAFLPAVGDAHALTRVVPLLQDADPQVRAAAAHVLRRRDGRREAAAIAALAARAQAPELRLELLGLLADLDVPEAAPGLLPLLLDDDARVRASARSAVVGLRAFSLQPALVALLERALGGAAGPVAIAELVRLLDRVGDEAAFPALAGALVCEERVVWEAVLDAARARGRDDHVARLGELLAARRPLPAPLATLALGELVRAGRKERAPIVERLAGEGAAHTVRRAALHALSALAPASVEASARALIEATQGELAAKVAEIAKTPGRAKAPRPLRREAARLRATVRAGARALVAGAGSVAALRAVVKALPAEARGGVVRAEAGARGVALAGTDDLEALWAVLADLGQERPAAALVLALRDRRAPDDLLAAGEVVQEEDPTPWLTRALVVAELRAGRDAPAQHRARLDALDAREAWLLRRLYLEALERWRPALRPLMADFAAQGRKAYEAERPGPGRERRAQETADFLGRVAVRLGDFAALDDLQALATDGGFRLRLLAALGTPERLDAAWAQHHGEKERGLRAESLRLLGEVGGGEAAARVAARAAEPVAELRAAAADGLGLAGHLISARAALQRLLDDAEPAVRARALLAAARLRDPGATGAALVALGSGDDGLVRAACAAVARLGLDAARGPLLALLALPAGARPPQERALLAARTLAPLAQPEDVALVLEALRRTPAAELASALAAVLLRCTPEERLDEVGALLAEAHAPTRSAAVVVLAAREHRPALPALLGLLRAPEAALRAEACTALALLGDPAALPALLRLVGVEEARGEGTDGLHTEREDGVRAAALRAVGALQGEAARPLLRERLRRAPGAEVAAACEALAALEPDEATSGELLVALRDATFDDLQLLAPDEAPERLRERLRERSPGSSYDADQAAAAGRALLKVGAERDRAQARALLWRLVEAHWAPPEVLLHLAPWLRAGSEPGETARLEALAARPQSHPATRGNAALLLAELDPARAAPLVALVLGPGLGGAFATAAPAAGLFPPLPGVPAVLDRGALRRGLGLVSLKLLAVAALSGAGEAWRGALREALLDPSEAVRRAARAALEPARADALSWGGEA